MKLGIFCVFDSKAGAFTAPFVAFNAPMAQRSVAIAVRDPESMFHKFPEDFQLFQIGVFSDDTGLVEGITPTAVCNLVNLKEKA